MISKELKKLSRRELVDVIYQLKKNEQQLQEELAALQQEAQDKRIRLSVAGSIADAAVSLTNIFSTAQVTADLYLQEIICMKSDAEKECAKIISEAKKTAADIVADSQKKQAELSMKYKVDYQKWQQLRQEIRQLEKAKEEGLKHGEET